WSMTGGRTGGLRVVKHYFLMGEKVWVNKDEFAGRYAGVGKIEGEEFSAFLVRKAYTRVVVGSADDRMAMSGAYRSSLLLIAFNILNIGRFKLGAMCLGGGRVSLENAISYARQRKAFGKVIADFGLVREKIANMAVLIYVGESLVYRTVAMMDAALSEVDT